MEANNNEDRQPYIRLEESQAGKYQSNNLEAAVDAAHQKNTTAVMACLYFKKTEVLFFITFSSSHIGGNISKNRS